MKKLFSLLFLASVLNSTVAQQIETEVVYGNWEKFEDLSSSDISTLITREKNSFGLSENDDLQLASHKVDVYGIEHHKYQQFYYEVKVEGGEYVFHSSPDKLWGNGRLVIGLVDQSTPSLTEEEALQNALIFMNADRYYWEDESAEELIKRLKNNEEASFYPEGELIYGQKEHSQEGNKYHLLWKFDIYSFGEMSRQFVYVDAQNGEIKYSITGEHNEAAEGTAVTRYHGEQTIITDSISPNEFQLIDPTRGGGIETYNLSESSNFDYGVIFTDEDNNWDNANAEMDEAAGDVHWSMEMTYDYYLTQHGRDSYDDNGSPIVSYVHYGQNYANAAWLGLFAFFGDGSDNPWTSIDIVGHELTHGVTKNSAGLIFYYESAALNESFSDIFGTAIEFYAYPDSANWQNGIQNFIVRDMSAPNNYGDPDTYHGSYWATGSADYGGSHTNSGVQNYWFYLLTEGGSGVNDLGNSYNVSGIGIDDAATIAYRNLTVYLTSTATYQDARQGAIQSAIDIYGECSNEVQQVLKSWHAVGLGSDTYAKDLQMMELVSPSNNCELSAIETVEVMVKYNASGCSATIDSGTSIELAYQLNNEDTVFENFTLTNDLNEGELFIYSFDQSISLPDIAEGYDLSVWVNYNEDEVLSNNALIGTEIQRKYDHGSEYMGFENLTTSRDSFYVETGKHAYAKVSSSAENTGNRGFLLSAFNTSGYLSNFADDPENNFEQNPEYISKICFCVDAQEWEAVRLDFDMKQTHSMFYMDSWGNDSTDYASSMRMLINGVQFGEQFHPNSYSDDPFVTYIYLFDQLGGTYFEFCFESKNYLNSGNDPISESLGDNTYLDNVRFINQEIVSVSELEASSVHVYPNPSNGLVTLESTIDISGTVELLDPLGRSIMIKQVEYRAGGRNEIDLSKFGRGMYTIRIRTENSEVLKKLIIH